MEHKDPILDEIRKIRRDMDRECASQGKDFFELIKNWKNKGNFKFVRRQPKKFKSPNFEQANT